jgi:hypothetical protein
LLDFAIAASCMLGLAAIESAMPSDPTQSGRAPDPKLLEDLVYGNRILYQQGVLDAYGHLSVRHDKNPNRFLLAAPAFCEAAARWNESAARVVPSPQLKSDGIICDSPSLFLYDFSKNIYGRCDSLVMMHRAVG